MSTNSLSLPQCLVFFAWVLLASLPCMFLSAWHHAPLAGPNTALSVKTTDDHRAHAWHFIACDCPCSASIFDQLRARKPHPHYREHIVLLGDSQELDLHNLQHSGWDLISGAESEAIAQRLKLVGAPWFLVQDAEQKTLYSGGYMRQQPQSFIPSNDYRILTQLHDKQKVTTLPAFGCAVGKDIRNIYDPLAIKYVREE